MAGLVLDAPRPLIFGEILFDRFPDGVDVLGGAPFNVAWHLQAFGAAPLMVSRVGADPAGQTVQAAMARWGMDASALQVDGHKPTGQVTVTFHEAGGHDFDIVDDQAYDHIVIDDVSALPQTPSFAALYHGSLALRHGLNRASLAALKAKTQAPVFIDINLRAPWWAKDDVLAWIAAARWAKLNDEELLCLTGASADLENRDDLIALGHGFQDSSDLDLLVVTRGAKGALAFPRGAAPLTTQPAGRPVVVDTVGAGDAFSAVLLLGLIRAWPLETTLERAQGFASGIVGQKGGTVKNPDFYTGFKTLWGE